MKFSGGLFEGLTMVVCDGCGEHILVATVPKEEVRHIFHVAEYIAFDDWIKESVKWY